jgi:hypothetical protein
MRRGLLVTAFAAFAALALQVQLSGLPAQDRKDADLLEKKLSALLERGAKPPTKPARPLRTPISEREVNAYFKFQGKEHLPVGVLNPLVTILDAERVEARATVDLDAVRKAKERGWSDPLSWVTGTLEIRASGKLRAINGQGAFQLEGATLGGVPIPKTLLQELVAYYSRTPDSPNGFDLDQPFALPHQIRQVELQRGIAVIVQ